MKQRRNICFLLFCSLLLLTLSNLQAQDSLASRTRRSYYSFGFQASGISGTGISFGYTDKGVRGRVTGGILKTESETDYSYGIDFHFILANNPGYMILLGPSFGGYGSSNEEDKLRLALATCLELPLVGEGINNNICAGCVLYYPTIYFKSGTLNPSAGIYLLYNF